jgi:hypothetical protein
MAATNSAETVGRPRQYSDEELLDWIDAFVELNDVVPSRRDADGWPGPHGQTYIRRFGGWCEAVREAGYTPRGDA